MGEKKLYKSSVNRMLCGVCGGFAEYFNVDVTLIRVLWALATLVGASGILGYIVAAILMPDEENII